MNDLERLDRFLFDGWRRRIGTLSLLLALLFGTAWLLTRAFAFEIFVNCKDQTRHDFTISRYGIAWMSELRDSRFNLATGAIPWIIPSNSFPDPAENMESEANWQVDFLGFRSANNEDIVPETKPWMRARPLRIGVWVIPYWSIVFPLTLLSAWLLLGKPRTKQPTAKIAKDAAGGCARVSRPPMSA